MKKILSLSPSKIFIFCGLGLVLTLGAFWHHQTNQQQLDRLGVLNQGVSTCFNRISQTFTAMMIRDVKSPYLDRGFMGLSDECVNETIKGVNPFKKNIGRGYETLNQLISEVHWFHEKVGKLHEPMLKDMNLNASLTPLSNRFSKMEGFKVGLVDEIDASSAQLREVQVNDEFLMGAGLIIFVLSVSLLSLQEYHRIQIQRDIEKNAINLLRSGNANVGAIVDQLVDRALTTQGMPVTAQIFKDYHEELLEHSSEAKADVAAKDTTPVVVQEKKPAVVHRAMVETRPSVVEAEVSPIEEKITEPSRQVARASLKETMVSVQNVQAKELLQVTDVRDVQLAIDSESFEQIMSAAINQLALRRTENKKIQISNQIHSDRSVINLFLAGATFNINELEFCESATASTVGIDMNMIILKEMAKEADAGLHLENKVDRQGKITGMNIRFIISRAPKEGSKMKNLVSVVKGKKRDLSREMMN